MVIFVNDASQTLICPKCRGAMRTYERNAVTIDQCTECRGIFLDRGELERLIDAEGGYYAQGAAQQAPYPQAKSGHHSGGHFGGDGRGRKKGGFLSELFD